MEFGLSPQQALLQDSVDRYLKRDASLERVRRFVDGHEKRADDVWAGLCDLDLPALLVDEAHGGIGCTMLDAALVAETLGSHVAPVPFVSTVVMAPLAITRAGSEAQKSRWLPKLAAGRIVVGAALTEVVGSRLGAAIRCDGSTLGGRALFVLDFEADAYLVADQSRRLYLVEASAANDPD